MDIFAELAAMQARMAAGRWHDLEPHYAKMCEAADPGVANRIAAKDLGDYADRQFDAYCKALKKARTAAAIYCEYDIDNDWQSAFYVCPDYAGPQAGNDDWASRWAAHVRGSCIPAFARIYAATDKFCRTPEATAITLFLIARTAAALKAVVNKKSPGAIVICIGFHDQDPVHRL